MWRFVKDFLWPKTCVGCGKWETLLCDKCEVGLSEEEQICPVCARGSRYGLRHKYCQRSWSLVGLSCCWKYEGIARKLITEAKYNGYFEYLEYLAGRSWQMLDRVEFSELRAFLHTRPVVVTVPLSKHRKIERGFNQAELVGRSLALRYSLAYDGHVLAKVKETEQQVGKARTERLENLSNAFKISNYPNYSNLPKNVLLVDDVWTTGATLFECAKVLRQAGVRRVWGMVVAR